MNLKVNFPSPASKFFYCRITSNLRSISGQFGISKFGRVQAEESTGLDVEFQRSLEAMKKTSWTKQRRTHTHMHACHVFFVQFSSSSCAHIVEIDGTHTRTGGQIQFSCAVR